MIRLLAIPVVILAGCASTKPHEQTDECTQLRKELSTLQAKHESAIKAQKSLPSPGNDQAVKNFAGDISAYNAALAASSCH